MDLAGRVARRSDGRRNFRCWQRLCCTEGFVAACYSGANHLPNPRIGMRGVRFERAGAATAPLFKAADSGRAVKIIRSDGGECSDGRFQVFRGNSPAVRPAEVLMV